MATASHGTINMADSSHTKAQRSDKESKYGGFTRFEIELEFVQCLANPHYLLHLATLTTTDATSQGAPSAPLLNHPPFVAYLNYLQYFSTAPYVKYLTYPGPTLKNLELLQNERFRRDILSPDVVGPAGLRRSWCCGWALREIDDTPNEVVCKNWTKAKLC